jgi:hypothetical protein
MVVELTNAEMQKEDFVNEYIDVRKDSFKPTTIVSSFKQSGIWLINQEVFKMRTLH